MSVRERFPAARLPRTHYFLTVSRGDSVRAFALRPAFAWTAMGAAPLFAVWACAATTLALSREPAAPPPDTHVAEIESRYATDLADARTALEKATSRAQLDRAAFEDKMRDVLSRQAKLERRSAALTALATNVQAPSPVLAEARNRPPSALAAIHSAAGRPADSDLGGHVDEAGSAHLEDLGAARAFAPLTPASVSAPKALDKPRPLDGDQLSRVQPASKFESALSAAASDPTLDAKARVGLVDYSLDRVERAQMAVALDVGHAAEAEAHRFRTVIERTGLDAAALTGGADKGGVGGPFIPANPADPFDRAVSDASRAVEAAAKLRRLMPRLPLSYPLTGDAAISSGFGYRTDPFLGKQALHPGVDLVQGYGAEIKATAIGRVVHAGPMGGYGNAVEIDHGNGVATRYGHMSEVLVAKGEEVKVGDPIGRIGSTGRSTGPHLHYEVRVDGEPVDPERFLTAVRN